VGARESRAGVSVDDKRDPIQVQIWVYVGLPVASIVRYEAGSRHPFSFMLAEKNEEAIRNIVRMLLSNKRPARVPFNDSVGVAFEVQANVGVDGDEARGRRSRGCV